MILDLSGYKIYLSLRAEKKLKKINTRDSKRIRSRLSDLVRNVDNLDIKKLENGK